MPSKLVPLEGKLGLSGLVGACAEFFRHLESPELIQRITDAAVTLTGADRGAVFLATKDGKTYNSRFLTSNVATGLPKGAIQIDSSKGIAGDVFTQGRPLLIHDAQNDPRLDRSVDSSTGYVTRSVLSVPIYTAGDKVLGVLEMVNKKSGQFTEDDLAALQMIAIFTALALDHREALSSLGDALENQELRNAVPASTLNNFVPRSKNAALQELFDKMGAFAKSDSSILIEGESGCGKEIFAQMLHHASERARGEFVAINCAAIPESLFEAELFGVAKGAATGTIARKGRIELADGGTLFLDEIGELPLSMQAKLLRVLQERVVSRVGSQDQPRRVDFRVLAATNRDLGDQVRAGTFREDLYYRINVVRFRIPPLRERTEDIADLSVALIRRLELERNLKAKPLTPAALEVLKSYPWPGNIRQLQNVLENALITSQGKHALEPGDLALEGNAAKRADQGGDLGDAGDHDSSDLKSARAAFERSYILRTLKSCGDNKTLAAKRLGLSREGLRLALRRSGGCP